VTRDIRIERRYPHPPEAVWRWLANREAMAEWLMPNTFEPVAGHRFEFRTRPAPGFDGIVHCEVIEITPPRRLAFTWAGGGIDTVVTFDLVPELDGTRLVLTQAGFAGAKGVILSFMLGNGWNAMLGKKLPRLLASREPAMSPEGCGHDKSLFWRIFDRVFSR
jgi:uncharacterized protein YndB with AHSA1/START domain